MCSSVRAERDLLWAILERAILDALGQSNTQGKRMPTWEQDAKGWLFAHFREPPAWSVEWICEELGLDIQRVRFFIRRKPRHVYYPHRIRDAMERYGYTLSETSVKTFS